ncbi:MAG: hypothetical protein RJB24_269 [Candidatus Parcubacteria bacterium]|jgi:hypothetical protein
MGNYEFVGDKIQRQNLIHPVQRSCPPLNLSPVGREENFNSDCKIQSTLPPSQMGFAPVKPHGFPTFLHGKTTVFPTPFPDFQSTSGTPPPKLKYRRDLKPPKGDRGVNNKTKYRRLKGRPYEIGGQKFYN